MVAQHDIRTIVAQANLLAQGIMIQDDAGLMLTEKGTKAAIKRFNTLTTEEQLIIMALIKSLVYQELRNE